MGGSFSYYLRGFCSAGWDSWFPCLTVSRLASTSVYITESGKLERPWESYGWLLLLHQLLEGHAVCPGDLRHRRHVGSSLAGLQVHHGPVRYVGKLGRLLLRKTALLPKSPKLQCDRFRHHCAPLDLEVRGSEPRRALLLRACPCQAAYYFGSGL